MTFLTAAIGSLTASFMLPTGIQTDRVLHATAAKFILVVSSVTYAVYLVGTGLITNFWGNWRLRLRCRRKVSPVRFVHV